jgi:hypothetical protein
MSQPSLNPLSPAGRDEALGNVVEVRTFSPTGYYLGGAFIAMSLPIMVLWAILSNPSKSLRYDATVFGLAFLFSSAAGSVLLFKGWRFAGQRVELCENGMRFVRRGSAPAAFRFDEVVELRRKDMNGLVAELTFVRGDGRSDVFLVDSPADGAFAERVIAHFGGAWRQDDRFRLS